MSGNLHSHTPSISADGRYIAYRSEASDLVSGLQDTNNEVLVRFHSTIPGTLPQAEKPVARPLETRRAA